MNPLETLSTFSAADMLLQAHDAQRLLKDACTLATQALPEDQANWACVSHEMFPPSEDNHYRHLRIADFSDTVSALPPEELQVGFFTFLAVAHSPCMQHQ